MKWISVEQKPKKEGSVLVWVDNYWQEANYNGGDFLQPYYGQTFIYPIKNVTHWAEIEPPKQ